MKKIGWIGYEKMGKPMVNNLLNAGYGLTVYTRNKVIANDLPRLDFTDSLAEIVDNSDYIFFMLPNDETCEEVARELIGLPIANKLLINMSTISPDTSIKLQNLFKPHHARYIEAPVSGSIQPAKDGTLVVLTGGGHEAVKEMDDCFNVLGKKTIHIGDVGTAAKTKIGINYFMSILVYGLADTILFMEETGVKRNKMLEVINSGACSSGMTETKTPFIIAQDYPPAFPLKYMSKDLKLANQIGLKSSLGDIIHNDFRQAKDEFGEDDLMAIIKFLNKR